MRPASTLQRATWRASQAGPRVLHTYTLAYMVAWHRRAPGALADYMAAHGEAVTLEGASSTHQGSGVWLVNSGWPMIDWHSEPMGDNSAIWE